MSIMATSQGGGMDFQKAPEGTHFAVCRMIVDLGLQRTEYQGQEKVKPQIYVQWELPAERVEWEKDGEKFEGPQVIGKTYTLSLSEKATLFKDLTSWRGKAFTQKELEGFDVTTVAGICCQLTIIHKTSNANGNTYANIASVGGWPKGMDKIHPENGCTVFNSGDPTEGLPTWLVEKIDAQVFDTEPTPDPAPADDLDDEIPF